MCNNNKILRLYETTLYDYIRRTIFINVLI